MALFIDGRCVQAFLECQRRFLTSGKGGVDLVKGVDFYHDDDGDNNCNSEWLRNLYFTMLSQEETSDEQQTTDHESIANAEHDSISAAYKNLRIEYTPLSTDITTLSAHAARLFRRHNVTLSTAVTERVLDADAGCEEVVFTRVCCLVEMIIGGRGHGGGANGFIQGSTPASLSKGIIASLFHYSHEQVENRPERASSWFAVAGYYLAIGQYVGERAKRVGLRPPENENEERTTEARSAATSVVLCLVVSLLVCSSYYCYASSLRSSLVAQRAAIALVANSLHQQQ